ncbi:MAG TPA: phage terminase large subunit [Drouetiella sp.]
MSVSAGGTLRAREGSPQEHLLECPFDEILYGGARGGGKSYGVIMKIIQHHDLAGEDASILVLRRSYTELKHFIKISKRLLPSNGWIWRAGDKKFLHKETAAEIILGHLDDDDASNWQGNEYTLILVEEAGNFETPEAIDQLQGTMRSGAGVKPQLIMTANPGGVGNDWLKERYVDPAEDGFTPIPIDISVREDTKISLIRYYIPSTLDDNPDLANRDEYLARLHLSGPPHLVKAWVDGDWTAAPLGELFKPEHFSRTFDLQEYVRSHMKFVVQCWDTAFKKTKKSAKSACTTWGVGRDNKVYLLNAWADKVEFPELKAKAVELCEFWKPDVVLVEDKASGQSLIQELKRETVIPIKAVSTDSDKIARAYAVTSLFEEGNVLVPDTKEKWLFEYISEMCSFPKGKFADQVDSTTHALARIIYFRKQLEKMHSTLVQFDGSVWEL